MSASDFIVASTGSSGPIISLSSNTSISSYFHAEPSAGGLASMVFFALSLYLCPLSYVNHSIPEKLIFRQVWSTPSSMTSIHSTGFSLLSSKNEYMMSVFSETDMGTSTTLSLSSLSSLHDTIPIAEMITTSNVEKNNLIVFIISFVYLLCIEFTSVDYMPPLSL